MYFEAVSHSGSSLTFTLYHSQKIAFDIETVSADQDGSRLCPYLSFHLGFELALHLTILYGMAT